MNLVDCTLSAVEVPATSPGDERIGHWLGAQHVPEEKTRVALVGFPSDEGVRRNGGRSGASQAPRAIRERLYKMTLSGSDAFTVLLDRTIDLGNVAVSGNVESDQEQLGRVVGSLLDRDIVPIVLGGGHETAYGHFLGYVEWARSVRILNWDAHADVRSLKEGRAHSGSPFRQALEHDSGPMRRIHGCGAPPVARGGRPPRVYRRKGRIGRRRGRARPRPHPRARCRNRGACARYVRPRRRRCSAGAGRQRAGRRRTRCVAVALCGPAVRTAFGVYVVRHRRAESASRC